MDQALKESLRKKLEEARERFSRGAARKADEGRDSGHEGVVDLAEQSSSTTSKEVAFSQAENEAQMLQMVNGALDRMKDGSYGQCLSCGREIGQKRLEAVPWTHLCIDCQNLAEKMDSGRVA